MSDYTISASITLFKNTVTLKPNMKAPEIIESEEGFQVGTEDVDSLKSAFGLDGTLPAGLTLPGTLKVSDVKINTRTQDFQVAVEMGFQNFWMNTLAPDVLTLDKVSLFVDYTAPTP